MSIVMFVSSEIVTISNYWRSKSKVLNSPKPEGKCFVSILVIVVVMFHIVAILLILGTLYHNNKRHGHKWRKHLCMEMMIS